MIREKQMLHSSTGKSQNELQVGLPCFRPWENCGARLSVRYLWAHEEQETVTPDTAIATEVCG